MACAIEEGGGGDGGGHICSPHRPIFCMPSRGPVRGVKAPHMNVWGHLSIQVSILPPSKTKSHIATSVGYTCIHTRPGFHWSGAYGMKLQRSYKKSRVKRFLNQDLLIWRWKSFPEAAVSHISLDIWHPGSTAHVCLIHHDWKFKVQSTLFVIVTKTTMITTYSAFFISFLITSASAFPIALIKSFWIFPDVSEKTDAVTRWWRKSASYYERDRSSK